MAPEAHWKAAIADLSDQLAETEARYAMTRLLLQAALDQIAQLTRTIDRSNRWREATPETLRALEREAADAEALEDV